MGILLQPEEIIAGQQYENVKGLCGVGKLQFENTKDFEGVEKRLQLDFFANEREAGLRALSRQDIERILMVAKCNIVSELSDCEVDTYVLSESSLFIYPFSLILKTCGTTKLLDTVPVVLGFAAQLNLQVKCCKYSRSTFIFPEEQSYPHGDFSQEIEYLDSFFGGLKAGSKAYVLGDPDAAQNWHIYVAAASVLESSELAEISWPIYTLEICMRDLDRSSARNFYRINCNDASEMTQRSGITKLLPKSKICDYVFDPCGYSMNAVESDAISTVHVTPEEGFSYASFEMMGYNSGDSEFQILINKVLHCFKPAICSIAIHVSSLPKSWTKSVPWATSVSPNGFVRDHFSMERLPDDSIVYFYNFSQEKSDLYSSVLKMPVHQKWLMPFTSKAPKIFPEDAVSNMSAGQCPISPHKVGHEDFTSSMYPLFRDSNQQDSHIAVEHDLSAMVSIIGPKPEDLDNLIRKHIVNSKREDAFYIFDLGAICRLWETWKKSMPRVHPFYAVKCNNDASLLALLSSLGAGFDVASKAELDLVRSLGVNGDRIIFANPCKLPTHILHAAKHDVHRTTFDSEGELYKLHKLNPQAEVVLRIRVCDPGARCPLGVKYGAEMEECEGLLAVAKHLGLQVVGIAFHVGSGASDPSSFAQGIAQARLLFDLARSMGLTSLRILDIGGGFVSDGGLGVSFSSAAASINDALDKFFPPSSGVTVIAEPGRFFAEESFTLATQIFGCRVRQRDGMEVAEYWVNDGIYGSMNCLLYDHATVSVRALHVSTMWESSWSKGYKSTIFGPTCDGLDTVMQNVWLPRLDYGDWLVFPRMGAYTKSAASSFNGFDISGLQTVYVVSTPLPSDFKCASCP
ncbi:hypothetical protein KP509_02G051300 [Ceratopteris richardii]|uniref:ornithine decarboxylase n=1 Tax=Ceratopteris richardii TaxID=49495 RepID=A0A8T2V9N7_CERRI|nr:hypothetical protein KP509_02G051300 [Ceratopteris richardii]